MQTSLLIGNNYLKQRRKRKLKQLLHKITLNKPKEGETMNELNELMNNLVEKSDEVFASIAEKEKAIHSAESQLEFAKKQLEEAQADHFKTVNEFQALQSDLAELEEVSKTVRRVEITLK